MIISDNFLAVSDRLTFRHLSESDASELYLSWFEDKEVKKFILGAEEFRNKKKLVSYINGHNLNPNSILIGIFEKNEHIGNIKYEPINFDEKVATLGILIGKEENRGRGFGPEIIKTTTAILFKEFQINRFNLGVNENNIAAIRAYEKIGFKKLKKIEKSLHLELRLD